MTLKQALETGFPVFHLKNKKINETCQLLYNEVIVVLPQEEHGDQGLPEEKLYGVMLPTQHLTLDYAYSMRIRHYYKTMSAIDSCTIKVDEVLEALSGVSSILRRGINVNKKN